MANMKRLLSLNVNGQPYEVVPETITARGARYDLGLTGSKQGWTKVTVAPAPSSRMVSLF